MLSVSILIGKKNLLTICQKTFPNNTLVKILSFIFLFVGDQELGADILQRDKSSLRITQPAEDSRGKQKEPESLMTSLHCSVNWP